jgi:peptidoglycan/xylan/chitin deacetylase (PgdA/CDA1 family)
MIGINIVNNPALFTRAFGELHSDIAVHTWSHRYMTTLSNADAVAELGWTMEIIKNSTVSILRHFPITRRDSYLRDSPRVADYRGTGGPRTVMLTIE